MFDFDEITKKINEYETMQQKLDAANRKIAEMERNQPATPHLESEVAEKYRQSTQYQQLAAAAFMAFLQEKFMSEFATSQHGVAMSEEAQKQFKAFEKLHHNKEVRPGGTNSEKPKKQAS